MITEYLKGIRDRLDNSTSACSLYHLQSVQAIYLFIYFFIFLTRGHFFSLLFREREDRGREREKHRCEREASIGWLPLVGAWTRDHKCPDWESQAPKPGTESATKVCALTWNGSRNP